jgi:hypothetical protein
MLRWMLILFILAGPLTAQEKYPVLYSFDVSYGYGTILRHNKNIAHLVKAHPEVWTLGFNRKTYGEKIWQQQFNYPDWGLSFQYSDFRNEVLGKNFGLLAHYNFYFLNRNLRLHLAQGISYNTHPFDLQTNPKNNAFGSPLLASTALGLYYDLPNLVNDFGLLFGVSLYHYSNGSVNAPNTGTNILAFEMALSYNKPTQQENVFISGEKEEVDTTIHWNIAVSGGFNSSDYLNLGTHPFAVVSGYADKQLGTISTVQLGTEIFFSEFLREEISYVAAAFPRWEIDPDTDWKRVGIFAGHEFRIGDLGLLSQIGYYLYYPYQYESRVYLRVGGKYYFNDLWFATLTIKAHAANAEAIEFGAGIRL